MRFIIHRLRNKPYQSTSFFGVIPKSNSFFAPVIQPRQTSKEEAAVQTMPLMRKSENGGYQATPRLTSQLSQSKGGGNSLPLSTHNYMSQAFGADFSQVQVHTNSQAQEMSQGIQAKAFTHGSDIYFNRGQYSPESFEGKKLLAHELTHVMQQTYNRNGELQNYSNKNIINRFDLKDCSKSDLPKIIDADNKAREIAMDAFFALSDYKLNKLDDATTEQHIEELLWNHFTINDKGVYLDKVMDVFYKILIKFLDDDYRYECENCKSKDNAYVYGRPSNVHLCMNNLRGQSYTRVAEIIVHEMSHYVGGTRDKEYYYPGRNWTNLDAKTAIKNADSYEGFVGEL